MACCGTMRQQFQNGVRQQQTGMGPLTESVSPQRRGFLAQTPLYFEYLGDTGLTAVGPITGRRYRFNGPGARVAVDSRDAPSMRAVPNLRETSLA